MAEFEDEDVFEPATLEKVRDAIADTIEGAAHTIHDQVHAGPAETGKPAEWGQTTAEWLERLSEDVRQWDARGTESRVRASIRRHPGSALLLVGAAGMLLGRALLRRR